MNDRKLYFRLFQLDVDGNGIHVKADKTGRKEL